MTNQGAFLRKRFLTCGTRIRLFSCLEVRVLVDAQAVGVLEAFTTCRAPEAPVFRVCQQMLLQRLGRVERHGTERAAERLDLQVLLVQMILVLRVAVECFAAVIAHDVHLRLLLDAPVNCVHVILQCCLAVKLFATSFAEKYLSVRFLMSQHVLLQAKQFFADRALELFF